MQYLFYIFFYILIIAINRLIPVNITPSREKRPRVRLCKALYILGMIQYTFIVKNVNVAQYHIAEVIKKVEACGPY